MNIYVGNLNYATTSDELKDLFKAYGDVDSAQIISDKYTGKSRGFGFVDMPNDQQAQTAIDELNEKDLNGRKLTVNQAKPKKTFNRSNNRR